LKETRPQRWLRRNIIWPPPTDARYSLQQFRRAQRRRTLRHEHAHPGHRSRSDEAGYDQVDAALEQLNEKSKVESRKSKEDAAGKAQQLLQIHDSILVECPAGQAEAVAKLLKTTMEAVYPQLPVKLTVDTTIAPNWGEL